MRSHACFAASSFAAIVLGLSAFVGGCSKAPADGASARQSQASPPPPANTGGATAEPTGGTVLDRAREEVQAVVEGPTQPAPTTRPRNSEQDSREHQALLQAADNQLLELQRRERLLRQALDKVRLKADMVFGERLKDDPLAGLWAALKAYPGLDLEKVRDLKARIEQVRERIAVDREYDPAIVPAVAQAVSDWIRPVSEELDGEMSDALELRVTLRSVPLFFARSYDELNQLIRAGYLQNEGAGHPHYPEVHNVSTAGARSHAAQDKYAALRKKLARHAYALSVRMIPASTGGADPDSGTYALAPVKTRWTWPLTELYAVWVSYDYWYAWATDAHWYRGTTLRLDPAEYPKNSDRTRKLWEEFKGMIEQDFRGPVDRSIDAQKFLSTPSRDLYESHWSPVSLRRLARNPASFQAMFRSERTAVNPMDTGVIPRYPMLDGISTYFLTPEQAETLGAEPPPIPPPEATAAIREVDRRLDAEGGK